MADTLMWQRHDHPMLQGVYSMFLPLLERGVPVSSFLLERAGDSAYLSRFKLIILSYEDFKPLDESMNVAIADWVGSGGILIVLGTDGDELDNCQDMWWHKAGFSSPLKHLLAKLGATGDKKEWKFKDGWVLRESISPKGFANTKIADDIYLSLIRQGLEKAGQKSLVLPGSFCMQRGPFVIAHSETEPVSVSGQLVDIFDSELCLVQSVQLKAGDSGLYRDVAEQMQSGRLSLLHATHRVISCESDNGILGFTLKGPAGTPAVARIFAPSPQAVTVKAMTLQGQAVEAHSAVDGSTILVRFANAPEGVKVTVQ